MNNEDLNILAKNHYGMKNAKGNGVMKVLIA